MKLEIKTNKQQIARMAKSDISLPKGSIKKLIGRDLTWEDNPVELKEE